MAYETGRSMRHARLRMSFEADDVAAMVRKVFTDREQFQTAPTNLRPGSLFTWSAVIPAVFSACV
jgi:hypothetical protein